MHLAKIPLFNTPLCNLTPVECVLRCCKSVIPILFYFLQRRGCAALRRKEHKSLSSAVRFERIASPRNSSFFVPPPSLSIPAHVHVQLTTTTCAQALISDNNTHRWSRYPHVPAAIDLVSSDDYGDMTQIKNTRWFYKKFLYPKCGASSFDRSSSLNNVFPYRLLPHQRVLLIPPTYNTTCCASPLLPDVDACLLKQMRLYAAQIAMTLAPYCAAATSIGQMTTTWLLAGILPNFKKC